MINWNGFGIIKYLKESAKYILRNQFIIRRYINEVEALYEMSANELKARNESLFLELFRKAYDSSFFYHSLYTKSGIRKEDIKSIEDIKRLPIITKEDIKAHADEMLTVPKWKVIKNHTSGTTGTPLKVYEDWPSIWKEQAYSFCYRKRCGFTYGQPLVSLRGNLRKKDKFLKVHISHTLYLSSYNINTQTVDLYYILIKKHRPVAIEGYPSSLYALAHQMRDHGYRLHIPVAFTSSETLFDYQQELIEQQFETQIYDHYGTTERTLQLNESLMHYGYFESSGYGIIEYQEDGVISTSLINESFPLIRYLGNDIMETVDSNKKNSLICVKKIWGRCEDYVICKDGSYIMRLDFIFKKSNNVKVAQLIQKNIGQLIVRIVPKSEYDKKNEEYILSELMSRVGKDNLDVSIELCTMDDIIYSKRGNSNLLLT